MTGDKTQPQKLLEEIIPKDLPRDENEKYPTDPEPVMPELKPLETKFPTIEEQKAYWDRKWMEEHDPEHVELPKAPRKWSAARRRRYNVKKKLEQEIANPKPVPNWTQVSPPAQEEDPVAMIRFCPCCGRNIERFLS